MKKAQKKSASRTGKRTIGKTAKIVAKRSGVKKTATARLGARKEVVVNASSPVKGTAVCPQCGAVYYDKHWHTAIPPLKKTSGLPKKKCETCRDGSAYSGEVVVEGITDAAERAEIAGLIRNVGKRATLRDPEERILHIHDDGVTMRVFTSENQLAVSIGKQIDQARKGGRLEIVWSKEDMPVRVHWHAPAK